MILFICPPNVIYRIILYGLIISHARLQSIILFWFIVEAIRDANWLYSFSGIFNVAKVKIPILIPDVMLALLLSFGNWLRFAKICCFNNNSSASFPVNDDSLASVDKGIHNKTTKYGLPTYWNYRPNETQGGFFMGRGRRYPYKRGLTAKSQALFSCHQIRRRKCEWPMKKQKS